MRILVITNDGTVFLKDRGKAEDMFGGRVTEVLRLKRSLSGEHDVSLAVISGRYGMIDGNETISGYAGAPDTAGGYAELQVRTDYAGKLRGISKRFDMTMVFVPKEMMRILIGKGSLPENTLAVTSPEFRDMFERNGWTFLERKGARVGKENLKRIISFSVSSS
jgi:hypothetical protein